MYFRNFAIVLALTAFSVVNLAQAQWGTGMYGGMQSCGYPTADADGASSYLDELKEIADQIKVAQDEIRKKKQQKLKADREVIKFKATMERSFNADGMDIINTHVDEGYSCRSYKGIGDKIAESGATTGTVNGQDVKQNDIGNIEINKVINLETLKNICPVDKTNLVGNKLCNVKVLYVSESIKIDKSACSAAVNNYPKSVREVKVLTAEIEALNESVKLLKKQMTDARKVAVEDMKEALRERTEGGVCLECLTSGSSYQKRETDWPGVAANVFTGLAGLYMGYKTNQMVSDYNSSIGFASQPNISSMAMGFPYLLNGVYGALGGGVGSGAFGCGGTVGGGGNWNGPYGMAGPFGMGGLYNPGAAMSPWGYPQGMVGAGMGGGMYMPGMGSWGMNGPWGLNPMGMGMFPGAGAAVAGGFGFQMPGYGGAYPWMGGAMGIPGMGFQMGGAMGFPGYGYAVGGGIGGAMGYPGMGMPGMGMQMMGGMMPGMGGPMGIAGMGMQMMGGAMGYPGMGMPGMGMQMMGGAMGYPGMGMPGMGMQMMGGAMGYPGMGMPGMGMQMMGGAMGFPGMGMPGMGMQMMGGAMGMDSTGSMQMQQQMMQMQMQQYQMQMQQQSRYYENYMQKQRAMMGLQQELAGLMNRIQMVQSGSSMGGTGIIGGGYLGVGGTIGGSAFGGGSIAAPPPLGSQR